MSCKFATNEYLILAVSRKGIILRLVSTTNALELKYQEVVKYQISLIKHPTLPFPNAKSHQLYLRCMTNKRVQVRLKQQLFQSVICRVYKTQDLCVCGIAINCEYENCNTIHVVNLRFVYLTTKSRIWKIKKQTLLDKK